MARLPAELQVSPALRIPRAELSVRTARSGGPGGQHVNKTSSKVELRWNVLESGALTEPDREWLLKRLAARLTEGGDLIVQADAHREQGRNLTDALDRMVEIVQAALRRPRPRRKTRPTKGSKERRLTQKRQRGETKRRRRPPGTGD